MLSDTELRFSNPSHAQKINSLVCACFAPLLVLTRDSPTLSPALHSRSSSLLVLSMLPATQCVRAGFQVTSKVDVLQKQTDDNKGFLPMMIVAMIVTMIQL